MNHALQTKVRKAGINDFVAICELLKSENLPTEDIQRDLPHFFVIDRNKKVVAVIGLEIYGEEALLRSKAVDREYRNQSMATSLIYEVMNNAGSNGVKKYSLLQPLLKDISRGRDFL